MNFRIWTLRGNFKSEFLIGRAARVKPLPAGPLVCIRNIQPSTLFPQQHLSLHSTHRRRSIQDQPGPAWTGLDQPGPDWASLDRPGLDWTRLDRPGPAWTRLDRPGPAWASLDQPGSSHFQCRCLTGFSQPQDVPVVGHKPLVHNNKK